MRFTGRVKNDFAHARFKAFWNRILSIRGRTANYIAFLR